MPNINNENPKMLVAGSLMVDIITVIANTDIEQVSMSNATASYLMLEQGRKIDAESISTHVGGGAANVGVSMKRQGLDVDVFCARGAGLNGDKVIEVLAAEGVGQQYIKIVEDVHTGTSVLVSSHDHNAAIFTHRGANGYLTADDVSAIDFSAYDTVYLGPLSNDSADIYLPMIEAANAAGCYTAANPGIRQLTSRTDAFLQGAKDLNLMALNFEEVRTLLPLLPVSECKGCHFVGGRPPTERMEKGLNIGKLTVPLAEVFKALQAMGAENMLITDGKQGAYLFDGDTLHYSSSATVEPKGTAGAGDAYISTFVAGRACGHGVATSMARAAVNSASVVGYVDTQTGLMTADALKDVSPESCKAWTLSR